MNGGTGKAGQGTLQGNKRSSKEDKRQRKKVERARVRGK